MKIEYDPAKRDATTFEVRGLDMARAGEVSSGPHLTLPDIRFDYGEETFPTIGRLEGRMIVLAWTRRNGTTRVISMRKTNGREEIKYRHRPGRSG